MLILDLNFNDYQPLPIAKGIRPGVAGAVGSLPAVQGAGSGDDAGGT
jgi:hypothetical protein